MPSDRSSPPPSPPLPPIPAELHGPWMEHPGRLLSSGPPLAADTAAFLERASQADLSPYVAFGAIGYGLNSNRVVYELVLAAIAVRVDLPFGNVYADAEAELAEVERVYAQVAELVVRAEAAAEHGKIPAGRRFCAVEGVRERGLALLPGTLKPSSHPLDEALHAFAASTG